MKRLVLKYNKNGKLVKKIGSHKFEKNGTRLDMVIVNEDKIEKAILTVNDPSDIDEATSLLRTSPNHINKRIIGDNGKPCLVNANDLDISNMMERFIEDIGDLFFPSLRSDILHSYIRVNLSLNSKGNVNVQTTLLCVKEPIQIQGKYKTNIVLEGNNVMYIDLICQNKYSQKYMFDSILESLEKLIISDIDSITSEDKQFRVNLYDQVAIYLNKFKVTKDRWDRLHELELYVKNNLR